VEGRGHGLIRIISWHLTGMTEENHINLSHVRQGVPVKNWTKQLLNTSLDRALPLYQHDWLGSMKNKNYEWWKNYLIFNSYTLFTNYSCHCQDQNFSDDSEIICSRFRNIWEKKEYNDIVARRLGPPCALGYQEILLQISAMETGRASDSTWWTNTVLLKVQGQLEIICAVDSTQNCRIRKMWDNMNFTGTSQQTEASIPVYLLSDLPHELTVILIHILWMWKLARVWQYVNKRTFYFTFI
jgi:hypothetical protein